MSNFKYKVSVVIPVYNCEEYLEGCIKSLFEQTMPQEDFQIVFVNDGSSDNGGKICGKAAKKHSNITYFKKENGGVSSARNKGMELSEGKYILFLDADDTLSDNTLEVIYNFFEEHYDETDLVTYKIIPYWENKRFAMHYRYKFLNESGVYDLNDEVYCYIAQTTMNICVKNNRENNILFDTSLVFHEDQKYCYDIVKEKMTIGFCSEPQYLYLRHPESTTSKRSYAYYIFEDTMHMWESLFGEYEDAVPPYLQSLFINDLNWKGLKDILIPYHYPEAERENAENRLISLISRLDDNVILKRPSMDVYHKHFLLKLKDSKSVDILCGEKEASLMFDEQIIYRAAKIAAVVNRFKVTGNKLHFDAFLKSPVFMYSDKPTVYIIADGERKEVEITESLYDYYKAGFKTAKFWRIVLDIDVTETKQFEFEVEINGYYYKLSYYYSNSIPLQRGKKRRVFFNGGRCYREENGVFSIYSDKWHDSLLYRIYTFLINFVYYFKVNPRIVYHRICGDIEIRKKQRSWIYLDRYGVFDNAYDQFKHDIKIKDGVKRYYILNECDWDKLEEKFEPEERKYVVRFQSHRHKMLYLSCEKLITSFSNLSNICPFGPAAMRWYADLAQFETVYLQHGILHATLRNMYAKERSVIDKVVVSSEFEVKNFVENYGYSEDDLIKSCMPRYDFIEAEGTKKNRIVFSPSWRSNLIGPLVNNSREEMPDAFVASDFYKQVNAILNSDRLHKMLEENDLYLDFKNHPIFKCYNHLFEVKSDRICLDGFDTNMDEYKLMITDYSSIVFDSVYMNCPVIYFVPDYDKFLAGVSHGYRKLDLPMEEGFGPFTQTADELLDRLEEYIGNGFKPQPPYSDRMNGFFLYRDNNCRDRLYDAIK